MGPASAGSAVRFGVKRANAGLKPIHVIVVLGLLFYDMFAHEVTPHGREWAAGRWFGGDFRPQAHPVIMIQARRPSRRTEALI